MRQRPAEVEGSRSPHPGGDSGDAVRPLRDLRAFWRPLAARGANLIPATVCKLSPSGVALRVGESQRPGAILVVRFEGPTERLSAPRLAHVKHATEQGDGGWLLGCAFSTPLAEGD